MKILHAFDMFTPYGGGIVTVMRDVTKALAARGHQVVIYASDYKKDQAFIDSMPENVEVRLFPTQCKLFNFYYMPSLREECKQYLQDFDIIHLQAYRSYQNLVISKEARLKKVPYIMETHGTLPRTTGGKRSPVWLLKHLFDAATGKRVLLDASRVIAHNEASTKEYVDFGVDRHKVILLQPPFDIAEFANLPTAGVFRNRYGIQDKKIILSLGRIHRIKGLNFLLDTFALLTETRNDMVLVIAGNDDGYLSNLKIQAQQLGLTEKVIFTGFIQGETKLSALRDSDVLVQPSLYEYNSRVMYEAILCGTPVIISDGTMTSEGINKTGGGYLYQHGNMSDLAAKIQEALEIKTGIGESVRKAASYIRTELSLERVAERYEQLYLEVIEEARQTSRG